MSSRSIKVVFLLSLSLSSGLAFSPSTLPSPCGLRSRFSTTISNVRASMGGEANDGISRREALLKLATVFLTLPMGAALPQRVNAATGSDIWTAPLHNRYFLVRAGEPAWETDGNSMISHPVHKLHLEKCGLSSEGYDHAFHAAEDLAALGFGIDTEPWVWTSTHVASTQTAQVICSHHKIPNQHMVPEYSFLDQRGYGGFEGSPVAEARAVVWKEDARDEDYRMPPNEDGTPNESLRDVQVRVKQALQIMETQYQALDIALIAPDSDTLSTLHCSLEGRPLVEAHSFHFSPGEVRVLDYRERVEPPVQEWSEDYGKLQLTGVQHNVMRVSNNLHTNGPGSFLNPHP